MSAEYAAERIADAIAAADDAEVAGFVEQDMRSHGYFFDVTLNGRTYEVLVIETRGGAA